MKHILSFHRFRITLLLLMVTPLTWGYDFVVDGIYYNKNSDGTSVTVTYKTVSDRGYVGSVFIPSAVTHSGIIYSVTSIGVDAFKDCVGLAQVVIPNSVTSIEKNAFSFCEGLTSITIPESVTSICDYAFFACEKLKSVTIPNSVISIGEAAFANCSALTSITIPEGFTSISNYAFSGCSSLTSVTIPNSVISIGNHAFGNCIRLSNIDLKEGLRYIEDYAFYECSIKSLLLPSSVLSIGDYSFGKNTLLVEVKLNEGLSSIGRFAFSGDYLIESLYIPNSVTSIGAGALTLGSLGQREEIKLFRLLIGNGLEEFPSKVTVYEGVGWSFPREVIFGENIQLILDSGLQCRGMGYGNMRGATLYLLTNNVVSFAGCPDNRRPDCTIYVADSTKYSDDSISLYRIKNICQSDEYIGEYSGMLPDINLKSKLSGFQIEVDSRYYNVGSYSNLEVTLSNDTITSTITIPCNYTITKAPLTITPNDITISYGEEIPSFSCSYEGLKNAETPNQALSKLPVVTTNANNGIDAGEYKLYASGAVSDNYSLSYKLGILTIKPAIQTIEWNQTFQDVVSDSKIELNATSSSGLKIQYTSSNPEVAYVVDEGDKTYLYTRKDGTINLTATQSGNKNYEVATKVEKTIIIIPRKATGLELNCSDIEMKVGEYCTLLAKVMPESAIDKSVEWNTSDNTIASVSNGIVHALKIGEALIQAKTKDGSQLTANCIVRVVPTKIESISLNKTQVSLVLGNSERIQAVVLPNTATNKEIIWESENNNIVSVNEGLITAIGIGSTTVKARANDGSGVFATCLVIVSPIPIESIELSPSTSAIDVGESITLSATIIPSSASNKELSWQSSNNGIASVSNGVVTGITPGNVIITVYSTDGSHISATASVKVNDIKSSDIYIDKSSMSMYVDDSNILIATITPSDVSNNQVVWHTTDSSIAMVDNGIVTATGEGDALITATTADGTNLSASCWIHVKRHKQAITWNQEALVCQEGGEMIALDAGAGSGLPVKYSSADSEIVSIFDLDDVVYANPVKEGKTVISAYQQGNYKYEPAEAKREIEVMGKPMGGSRTLVAYYSQSALMDGIVAELTNQIASSYTQVYTQKIEPSNARIDMANHDAAIRDSVMNVISLYPDDAVSYPEIKPLNVAVDDYDDIILVYPIWNMSMAAPMQTFCFQNRDFLESKSVAYIEYDLFDEAGTSSNAQVLRLCPSNIADKKDLIKEWLDNSVATGILQFRHDKQESRDGIYDLQGRKISNPGKKGLYIIKGHKMLINDNGGTNR